jgi:hypothetical protein
MAGCGEGGGSTSTSTPADTAATTTTSTPAQGKGDTELVVTLNADGSGGKPAQQQVVTCPGADKAACQAIAALPPDPAAETPPNSPCTQIYGGPDTLVLQGTINGELVNARLSRSDGCEIERFDRFMPLVKALFPDYEPGQALGA